MSESDKDAFENLAKLAKNESGLILSADKALMVQSRIRPRMKRLGLTDLESYQRYVCSDAGVTERDSLISALTTNVSYFFREPHHYEMLTNALTGKTDRKINRDSYRIWSAGCSNGQEPYTIASIARDMFSDKAMSKVRILATDIDLEVLRFAKLGRYTRSMASSLTPEQTSSLFQNESPETDCYQIRDELKKMISFKKLNLNSTWPMQRKFDVIFCRNVVIYFDDETRNSLWQRFASALSENGLFFLGHSERIAEPEKYGFVTVGPTTYQKSKTLNG